MHLDSEQKDENGLPHKYYLEVTKNVLEEANEKIIHLLEEGIDNDIISQNEFEAMNPTNKKVGKFMAHSRYIQSMKLIKHPQKGLLSVVVKI